MVGGYNKKFFVPILAGFMAVMGAINVKAEEDSAAKVQLVWSDEHGVFQRGDCRPLKVDEIAKTFGLGVDESPKTTRRLQVASSDSKLRRYGDLANYVIEIQQSKGNIPNSSQPVRRSFWQVAMESEEILAVTCGTPEKNYLLFDVFTARQLEPLARIGVSAEEIAIFEKIEIHSPNEAELAIEKTDGAGRLFVNAAGHRQPGQGAAAKAEARAETRPAATAKAVKSPKSGVNTTPPGTTASTVKPKTAVALNTATASAIAATEPETPSRALSPDTIVSGLAEVVCVSASSVQVLASDLVTKIFSVPSLENVRPVQSFGEDKKTRTIDGRKVTYVKVQFPGRKTDANIGWLDSTLIRAKSKCSVKPSQPEPKSERPTTSSSKALSGDCCRFPMIARTTRSYYEGMRRFRAGRDGGRRLHAACDLYRPLGERVVAIAPGKVIRGRYYFYLGVYALEVVHGNGYVVRYGEVLGRAPSGTSVGDRVSAGQTIGYVGWIGNPNISPMLHFELFSGKASGALSRKDRPGFQRRSDLLDPTKYLIQWERNQFGKNW